MKKRIFGLIIGSVFLGIGIVCNRLSLLGNDTIAAYNFALVKLTNIPYSIVNILNNIILLIPMFIFMRKKINVGTILNVILTGIVVDLLMMLVNLIELNIDLFILRLLVGILGVLLATFGVSLYVQADFGIVPFDAINIILSNKLKFNFIFGKIIIDGILLILAFVIGNVIIDAYAVGIFTIVSCLTYGPLIKMFGNLINKYYYKGEEPNI